MHFLVHCWTPKTSITELIDYTSWYHLIYMLVANKKLGLPINMGREQQWKGKKQIDKARRGRRKNERELHEEKFCHLLQHQALMSNITTSSFDEAFFYFFVSFLHILLWSLSDPKKQLLSSSVSGSSWTSTLLNSSLPNRTYQGICLSACSSVKRSSCAISIIILCVVSAVSRWQYHQGCV
jgi:hypothetical protein